LPCFQKRNNKTYKNGAGFKSAAQNTDRAEENIKTHSGADLKSAAQKPTAPQQDNINKCAD